MHIHKVNKKCMRRVFPILYCEILSADLVNTMIVSLNYVLSFFWLVYIYVLFL